jgi:hypothetical protein
LGTSIVVNWAPASRSALQIRASVIAAAINLGDHDGRADHIAWPLLSAWAP